MEHHDANVVERDASIQAMEEAIGDILQLVQTLGWFIKLEEAIESFYQVE